MITFRMMSRWFLAVAFAAFAVPALAQNVKYFSLAQTSPTSPAPLTMPVTTTTVELTFTNIANGNANFSSFSIEGIVSGGVSLVITDATSSQGTPTKIGGTSNKFTLTDIGPVKRNESVKMTLTVVLGTNGCSNGQIEWKGGAWTGSVSSPSTNFQQQNANPVVIVSAGCTYSYTITPSLLKGDKDKTLTATVSNPAASPGTITSVTLTPPAGITTAATSYAVSIAAGSQANIDITASAPCDAAGAGGAWTSSVTGFGVSGGEQSTTVNGNCKLAFQDPPTSALPDTPFTAKVRLYNDAPTGTTISTFVGNVVLTESTEGCALTGSGPYTVAAAAGVATFNAMLSVDASVSTCTLKGATTIGTTSFQTADLVLPVFDATLACNPSSTIDALSIPTSGPGVFSASTSPTLQPGDPGYMLGIRVQGDPDKETKCGTLINYAVFNNILAGSGSMTDPLGNVVAPGFYSFSFDNSIVTNPLVAIVSTYLPEWSDKETGLPTRKTLICTAEPCESAPYNLDGSVNGPDWKQALVCLGTTLNHSSIPDGEKGCLANEAFWPVATSGCTAPAPTGGPWPNLRCLQVKSTVMMGVDPIWGR